VPLEVVDWKNVTAEFSFESGKPNFYTVSCFGSRKRVDYWEVSFGVVEKPILTFN